MTLKEALNIILKEGEGKTFLKWIVDVYYTNTHENFNFLKVKEAYSSMIKELLELDSVKTEFTDIVCIKSLDYDANNDYSKILYHNSYDCFVLENNDTKNHYGLIDIDWKELIEVPIKDTCITRYGLVPVVGSILYNMSWYGLTYKDCKKGQADFEKKLSKILEETESADSHVHKNFDDIYEVLGLPTKTKEEKERNTRILSEVHKKMHDYYLNELKYIFPRDN